MSSRLAIYRIHYGTDFLRKSIESILPAVDKVIVFISHNPWVVRPTVNYLGEEIPLMKNPDNPYAYMGEHFIGNPKVVWWDWECNSPRGQFSDMYSHAIHALGYMPESVLFMEPDMVFGPNGCEQMFAECGESDRAARQVELWKGMDNRVPARTRFGPVIYKEHRVPETDFGAISWKSTSVQASHVETYNFGFCVRPEVMLYKHLLAIQFSTAIGDSIPSQEWYRDKWLNWTPETTDLEISENWKSNIKKIEPYSMSDEMKEFMELK